MKDFLVSGDKRFSSVSQSNPELAVWVRSLDGNIVLFAPAPVVPDEARVSSNQYTADEFAGAFYVPDAGVCDMALLASGNVIKETGAYGTEASTLPLRGGPWRLRVSKQHEEHSGEAATPRSKK